MLAAKTFTAADQTNFALWTGDWNPMHMDPVVARRTPAGSPVVHGIHTLLWLLDSVSGKHTEIKGVATVKARFFKPVLVGDQVEAWLVQLSSTSLRLQARVGGVEVVSVVAGLGEAAPPAPEPLTNQIAQIVQRQSVPADLAMEEMENHSGRLLFTQELAQLREEFPSVTRLLRPSRVEALGCSTYLIGMVVPGLHSIYGALDLQLTTDASIGNEIQFAVTTVDPRLRRVQLKIRGPGMSGSLEAFTRVPPVRQPAIAEIAEHVANGEFAASTALVIGGSRGLGELTAKIIAAGGGRAIVSYAQGKRDAETLASEITDWGGKCEILSYDIREQADRQLEALKHSPTHLYYFATPTISKGNMRGFSPGRFAEFNEFYIHGFARLIDAAARRTPEGISVFYPSSAFVRDRPQHMTEYAMSKAAGEILCADIARTVKGVRVHTERLPRLRTDQTSTLSQINVSSSVSIMLPIIRKLHERTAPEG